MQKRLLIGLAVLVPVLAVIAFYFWRTDGQPKEDREQCVIELRQMGNAISMYSSDNKGFLPETLKARGATGELLRYCPVAQRHGLSAGNQPPGAYIYAKPGPKTNAIRRSSETVMPYEPLSYHDGDGIHLLFADGHVKWIDKSKAPAVISALEAGRNPPNGER